MALDRRINQLWPYLMHVAMHTTESSIHLPDKFRTNSNSQINFVTNISDLSPITVTHIDGIFMGSKQLVWIQRRIEVIWPKSQIVGIFELLSKLDKFQVPLPSSNRDINTRFMIQAIGSKILKSCKIRCRNVLFISN